MIQTAIRRASKLIKKGTQTQRLLAKKYVKFEI